MMPTSKPTSAHYSLQRVDNGLVYQEKRKMGPLLQEFTWSVHNMLAYKEMLASDQFF